MAEELKVEHPIKLMILENGTKIVAQVKENDSKSVSTLFPMEMMNSINPANGKSFFILLEYLPEKLIKTPEIVFKEDSIMVYMDVSDHLADYYKKCLNTLLGPKEPKEASLEDIVINELKAEGLMEEETEEDFSNIKEGNNLEEFLKSLPLKPKEEMN
jgi:hypothetical protein